MDYFTAYSKRMDSNTKTLLKIGSELKELGCKVYSPNEANRNIGFIIVIKDDKKFVLAFNEVPYRWVVSCDIDYKLGKGSSTQLAEHFGPELKFKAKGLLIYLRTMFPTPGTNLNNYIKL